MRAADNPLNETSRVEALGLLNILDTLPEERFDRLTRMAKRLFGVPIASVTLVDTDRQWFKSSVGLTDTETPRSISFCSHAILDDGVMLVPDAREDERFFDNPLVVGDPGIRFYAGYPLKVGAYSQGTLCVIDNKPREFDSDEIQLLRDLGELAEQELAAVQQATTDHLTGISNRRGFEALARHAVALCKRMGREATLLLFDLNGFKQINDVYGHAEGDRALKTFASCLTSGFRESDVIGRLGGDEFAVLLTGASGQSANQVLGGMKERLLVAGRCAESTYEIRFSVGQVELDLMGNESIEELLATADGVMYASKKASGEGR
jgi:diguanylate cyclase (GGDEF)-like protein